MFRHTADVNAIENEGESLLDEDEAEDLNEASEMVLLERVVAKLARLAEVQARTAQSMVGMDLGDMKEEEVGGVVWAQSMVLGRSGRQEYLWKLWR